jgi:hypothetical protein
MSPGHSPSASPGKLALSRRAVVVGRQPGRRGCVWHAAPILNRRSHCTQCGAYAVATRTPHRPFTDWDDARPRNLGAALPSTADSIGERWLRRLSLTCAAQPKTSRFVEVDGTNRHRSIGCAKWHTENPQKTAVSALRREGSNARTRSR